MKRTPTRRFPGMTAVLVVLIALTGSLIATPAAAAVPEPVPLADSGPAWRSAGAHLPINYDLAKLTSPLHYVAASGSDDGGDGSISKPYATLAKAYSVAAKGDVIVIRGGIYRQGNVTIAAGKPVHIIAYPGEVPVFNGAMPADGGWTGEGGLQYRGYSPMPVTDGNGISFTGGQNLTGVGDGKFPDEAWVGDKQLKQVQSKEAVTDGAFFVDHGNGRIYLTAADVAKGNVEVANLRHFLSIQAKGTIVEGLRVTRFANGAGDYGVFKILDDGDYATLKDVEITDTAFIAVTVAGDTARTGNLNEGTLLKNVTITHSNWMGVNATYTNNLVLDGVDIEGMNQWGEFANSPQSGALKTSRTWYTKVLNSQIRSNHSHGLWFDQSNYGTHVVGNVVTDNSGAGVFYEISDDLLLANNYIRTLPDGDRAVKLAGSSGLRLVNNTIIGGSDPIGVYVDSRSRPGCANPASALCGGSYGSDRDSVRPYTALNDWFPRLDLMINNIVVYPARAGYCGAPTAVCITGSNSGAEVSLSTIIHQAEMVMDRPDRPLVQRPQSLIDGNVYANDGGAVISTPAGRYGSPAEFGAAMAGAVGINGLEAAGLAGNQYVGDEGSPTAALTALHGQAAPVPADPAINKYIPAGTRHYGVLFK